ncbi:hypothetical protein KAI46_10495 [bacterium]|nr:hypothetical protein [bacterium]
MKSKLKIFTFYSFVSAGTWGGCRAGKSVGAGCDRVYVALLILTSGQVVEKSFSDMDVNILGSDVFSLFK